MLRVYDCGCWITNGLFFFFFREGLEMHIPRLIFNINAYNVNNLTTITVIFLYAETPSNGTYPLNIYIRENLKNVRTSLINVFLLFTPYFLYVPLIDYRIWMPFPPKLLLFVPGINCFFPWIRHTVQSRYSTSYGVLTSYLLQCPKLFSSFYSYCLQRVCSQSEDIPCILNSLHPMKQYHLNAISFPCWLYFLFNDFSMMRFTYWNDFVLFCW